MTWTWVQLISAVQRVFCDCLQYCWKTPTRNLCLIWRGQLKYFTRLFAVRFLSLLTHSIALWSVICFFNVLGLRSCFKSYGKATMSLWEECSRARILLFDHTLNFNHMWLYMILWLAFFTEAQHQLYLLRSLELLDLPFSVFKLWAAGAWMEDGTQMQKGLPDS